ncbi:Zn-dependent M28 family amino/carboxypeptidase [Roseivirga pacifica]|uniref:Carboxypeptidase Q n=1 Tax=Roseivirga pacifica TaxID=1267423 RepID=A0A1I0MUA5_9BACT|nr:M20/M25/M40 family metallo-hydrolase [Roseivirga pacifica]RKQ50692.1 Zn-dependent M28 family amino/carboxypeptidase [Roseivirga pacifica]SEV92095.1 Zn-dependent amino-or carboxypeptidase, M28 family [Roseivirga pacifica]
MKRGTLFFALLLAVSIQALGFQNTQVDYDAVYRIKDEGFNNSQVMDIAWNLTDRIGPRLTGSEGLKNAYDWTSATFKEWGLSNVEVQPWGEFGKGWDVRKAYIAMTVPYYQALIGIPKAWTLGTNKLVSAEVVYVDAADEAALSEYKGKLKGKVVMLPTSIEAKTTFEADARRFTDEELDGMTKRNVSGGGSGWSASRIAEYRRAARMRNAAYELFKSEGVAMVLNTHRGGGQGTFFTSNGSRNDDSALPEMEIAPEHYNRMVRLVTKGEKVMIEADTKTSFHTKDQKGYNVIAEIPGSDPSLKDEVVMLGAHLDSWFAGTGATDNAAGSAAMMEAIRILKESGVELKRTVRVALWSGEEQGLYGSRNYVQNTFMNDKAPNGEWEKFSAYFNMDNGTGAIRGIYLQENEAARPLFEEWFKPFHEIGASTVTIRNTGGTDHQAFDGIGLPGYQFIQDPIDYGTRTHHTNMDLYERLQAADMKKNAVIIATMVMQTANMDEKMPRKPKVFENR